MRYEDPGIVVAAFHLESHVLRHIFVEFQLQMKFGAVPLEPKVSVPGLLDLKRPSDQHLVLVVMEHGCLRRHLKES